MTLALLTLVLCCVSSEVFVRLPIVAVGTALTRQGLAASRVLTSRSIPERRKERLVPLHALRMGRGTLVLSQWFGLFAALIAGLSWLGDQVRPDFSLFLTSLAGALLALGFSVLYLALRKWAAGGRAAGK